MKRGRLTIVIVSVAASAVVGFSRIDAQPPPQAPFDVDRYQPARLSDILAGQPSAPGVKIVRDVPVRATVAYSGEFRELSADSQQVIQEWSTAMQVPIAAKVFRREVFVREGAQAFWLPVQEMLVAEMQDELERGESIEVFVVYIGQVDGRHVFLINAFDHQGPHRPRRGI